MGFKYTYLKSTCNSISINFQYILIISIVIHIVTIVPSDLVLPPP